MDLKSLALQLRQRGLRLFSALGLYLPETLHYIGGSDVLPAPLPRAQEGELHKPRLDDAEEKGVAYHLVHGGDAMGGLPDEMDDKRVKELYV